MTPYEITHAALLEGGHPAAAAALAAAGPTRAGDPPCGFLGFMREEDRVALARAAILAHTSAGTSGWCWTRDREQELADHIHTHGSWRHTRHDHTRQAELQLVCEAYCEANGADGLRDQP